MVAKMEYLKARGVNVFDFTTVFDNEPSPVYIDSAGHIQNVATRLSWNK
jgi:hypothetical protein